MKRIENVYKILKELCFKQYNENGKIKGVAAIKIANALNIQRTNASSDLNRLFKENKVEKEDGKPVLYKVKDFTSSFKNDEKEKNQDIFESVIGSNLSLKNAVQQAKAAIIYPPNGLHTLILGETGTGKSMFAEIMYKYARETGKTRINAPFVTFNCADYANNPQLIMAQLFGVKKGAYTGADKDKIGIVEKANEGILFLDEIHRLPPEGQEMLFYLIDKGMYRRLGESQSERNAKLLIICATTENIESTLLKTFTRRIPMIIKLPSLKDRTIEERYSLIKNFFKTEASCIKSDIMVTGNVLKALLLYDCSNNIGQLKSDIKLCCAKAFLENMMKRDKSICVHSEDLPQYMLRGIFRYKKYKEEIDKFISNNMVKFVIGSSNFSEITDNKIFNFYEALEEKRKVLESRGIDEKDIKLIMSLDIDTYLKKYILNINNGNLDDLYKIVDKKIVDIIERFLKNAELKLFRKFDSKILYALSMHISSSIERILSGKNIENHQLDDIKKHYKKEFEIANNLKCDLEKEFKVNMPEDEVGFITMFLSMNNEDENKIKKIGVIIAMHGESAATSIADVANRLLGENYAIGYNMSLDQKAEVALENLIEIVKKINNGKGILLLVDMGSLTLFGDMIYEKTKIPVKSVEMVSTPMVLEAARKALLGASLDEIYESCISINPYIGRIYKDNYKFNNQIQKNVIITACITGRGTAVKLKSILQQKFYVEKFGIDIISIDFSDYEKFKEHIKRIKREKSVLAIVSALEYKEDNMLFISTSDIFNEEKMKYLDEIFNGIKVIDNMEVVVSENINIDEKKYIKNFKKIYIHLVNTGIILNESKIIGLILHLACAIESIKRDGEITHVNTINSMIDKNIDKIKIIQSVLKPIETDFNIDLSIHEYINMMKIIYSL